MTNGKEKIKITKYMFRGTGLTTKERNRAKKRFGQYIKTYSIEKLSDLTLLEEKVFREELQERYKTKIGILAKEIQGKDVKVSTEVVPDYLLRAMDNNLKQILEIDEKLGLFQDKKQDDPFKHFKILEKKAEIYRQEHPEEFKTICPFCGKVYFLKRRTDKYEEHISPFFAENRMLTNKPLIELYSKGKLTKKEVAEVLNVSLDEVEFLKKQFDKISS